MSVVTICCDKCEFCTDIDTLSQTNPHRCPKCGGDLMISGNGEKTGDPLYGEDGELNSVLYDNS